MKLEAKVVYYINILNELQRSVKYRKNLSNHISRHSFGNIAMDSLSHHIHQRLYCHRDVNRTIDNEANFIIKEANNTLDASIKF